MIFLTNLTKKFIIFPISANNTRTIFLFTQMYQTSVNNIVKLVVKKIMFQKILTTAPTSSIKVSLIYYFLRKD